MLLLAVSLNNVLFQGAFITNSANSGSFNTNKKYSSVYLFWNVRFSSTSLRFFTEAILWHNN